jgi:hypothetical protein
VSKTKSVFTGIGVVILILILCFGLEWMGIGWKGFFGPKHAAVERKVFEQTRSYVHGKAQDLSRYRLQYLQAETQEAKDTIASTIRMQFAEVNPDDLQNEDLRGFLRQMMGY